MERQKELFKLINVLRRTSRMALQTEWTGGKEDAAAFCTEQYNRVLTRLKEMDPGLTAVFDPKVFKEFWEKSGREFEDMGEFIRESIDQWLRHKKEATRTEKGSNQSPS